MGSSELSLTALHVYPIKSAGGLAPREWEVDARGFRYDRRWMVVDGAGTMLSQRTHPRLALVRPSIGDGTLRVEADGMPPLELPLDPADAVGLAVTVWDDVCGASWAGERAAGWFADLLGTDCMLVHMPDSSVRLAHPRYAPGKHPVSFADAFPFLVLSEASLAELNRRLARPLPMDRFRPSLVLGGGEPHVEDHLEDFRAGGIRMRAVKPCDRCVVTTTDQATAERGVEPLRTLAAYRKVGGKVMFGQNVVHFGAGRLRMGDRLQGRLSERARVEL
jgi:uncharacterized protein YcbX